MNKSTCECGEQFDYVISPFMTVEKRVCPKCGRIHYVDSVPIDWERIKKAETGGKPFVNAKADK